MSTILTQTQAAIQEVNDSVSNFLTKFRYYSQLSGDNTSMTE